MNEFSTSHIESIKVELEDRLATLTRRLGKIQVHLRHEDGPLSADWEEQAVERENDEVLEALDDAGRLETAQIRHALDAIAQGTYGTCEACGDDIGAKRLKALPFTSWCIKCATEAEKH